MAKRNYGTGSMYSAAVDAIDPRTKALERENTAAITQRFTPMSPAAGVFRPGPSIGPTASPRDTMVPAPPVAPVPAGNPRLVTRTPMSTPAAVTPMAPAIDPYGGAKGAQESDYLKSARLNPVAPVATALPADDFGGASDVLPVEVSATVPKNRFGGNTNAMAMTSPAALNLAEVMAMGRADSMRSQSGGKRRDPNGIEAQALRGRWADAARNAFLGAMSDTQREKFLREENARSMESAALYKNTPGAIEGEAARKRDVDVAQAAGVAVKAKNDIAVDGMKQEAELKREELALRAKGDEASLAQADRLAARSEELRKTLSTDDRKDKLADREDARTMRRLDSLGRRIDKLMVDGSGVPSVEKQIAALQAEYDKLSGAETTTGKQPTADGAKPPANQTDIKTVAKSVADEARAKFPNDAVKARQYYDAEIVKRVG